MTPEEERKLLRVYQIGQIGTEMAIPIGIGFGLDYWLGTMPWLTVIGAVLGPILAFWHLLTLLRAPVDEVDPEKKA